MAAKKKPRRKKNLPAWRMSRDPNDRLIVAADNWVKAKGGTAAVMGPVSIMKFTGEPEHQYYVVIQCNGMAPVKKQEVPK